MANRNKLNFARREVVLGLCGCFVILIHYYCCCTIILITIKCAIGSDINSIEKCVGAICCLKSNSNDVVRICNAYGMKSVMDYRTQTMIYCNFLLIESLLTSIYMHAARFMVRSWFYNELYL